MIFSFTLLLLVASAALAQDDLRGSGGGVPCQLVPQSNIRGVCTRSAQCNGPNSYWIASFSWGRRRSRGCDQQPSNVRCCIVYKAEGTSPATTTTTTRAPVSIGTNAPITAPITVPAPITAGTTAGGGSQGSVTGVRAQYLEFHNDERACFGVPALQWSAAAERTARLYANKCVFEHSSRAERNNFGENLAAGSGARDEITLLQGWLDEQFNWNCESNSGNGVVGHYTQMIWRASTQLGCAAVVCNSNSPFGGRFGSKWTNVVCHYGEAGNFVGVHPLSLRGQSRLPCGSCARSVRTEDTTWGIKDEQDVLEVCVPQNAATADGSEASGSCVCPDGVSDGPCAPPAEVPCPNAAGVQCKDGTTLYPRQPACSVTCPPETSATSAALAAGALAAGAIMVL